MRILNNLNSNHYDELDNLISNANELFIISPFLMENFKDIISQMNDEGIKFITLITTLKDNSPDLFKKASSLHSFCVNCEQRGIDYKIHIDNKLHGKIYIASKDGEILRGIITSANFTDSGLAINHEWGIAFEDPQQLKRLLEDVFSVSSYALSKENLEKIIVKIDSFRKNNGEIKEPKFDLNVDEFIQYNTKLNNISDKRFFIKPMGSAKAPFSTTDKLSSDVVNISFSKKPVAVRVGDILICYAVGVKKLLGYLEVIDEPIKSIDENKRWPWSVNAKNLCPEYSDRWNDYNNTLSSIKESFDPNKKITNAGGGALGALQRGVDKIQLTEEFANHIIGIIEESV